MYMGRRWIAIWGALSVAAALAAVLLPVARHIRAYREHQQIAAEVAERIEAMDEREVVKQWKLARWYNRNLTLDSPEPGFREAYDGILNLGQGRMGLLEVPEWNLMLPITHGIGGEAGHDPDTPLPIGGQGRQTLLWLDAEYPWTENTEVYIEIPGARRSWRVLSVQVMPMGWPPDAPAGEEMLILACDRGNRRTIVRCVSAEACLTECKLMQGTLPGSLAWAALPIFAGSLLLLGHFRKKIIQHRRAQWQALE